MGSGSSKEARGETFSLEQVTVVPALEQADGKADQPRGTAGNESGMQNVSDEKVIVECVTCQRPKRICEVANYLMNMLDVLQPSNFLSEDIWERVAMHMLTDDWVRVSGTCKAMSRMCTVQQPSPDSKYD